MPVVFPTSTFSLLTVLYYYNSFITRGEMRGRRSVLFNFSLQLESNHSELWQTFQLTISTIYFIYRILFDQVM